MAWVRIHDAAMTHPKIVGLSDGAFRAWVWGLSYAQTHLTDGLLPRPALSVSATRRASELVASGLWIAVESGYEIHHFLEWNDSKDVVLRKRSEARDRANRSRTSRSERAPHVLCGVGNTEVDQKKKEKEDDGFNAFWERYPRKVGKESARKAFARLKPSEAVLEAILEAVEKQARSPQWTKDGGQFIPHASTWLNGRRWQDETQVGPTPIGANRHWSPEDCEHEEKHFNRAECDHASLMAQYRAGRAS